MKIKFSTIIIVIFLGLMAVGIFQFYSLIKTEGELINSVNTECPRNEPYKLAPEFERARSLRQQRLEEAGYELDHSFYNCINIEYSDTLSTNQAEGLFYFDENSSISNLKILVDSSYKLKDDLLTATLLQHEFVHVGQFVKKLRTGESRSCIDQEVEAFIWELDFLATLTSEEKTSLEQRLNYYRKGGYKNDASENFLAQLNLLIDFERKSSNYCSSKYKTNDDDLNWNKCFISKRWELVTDMVSTSTFYKRQCGL